MPHRLAVCGLDWTGCRPPPFPHLPHEFPSLSHSPALALCPPRLTPPPAPQSAHVVGAHAVRDFMVVREERNGDLTLSLKRLEQAVAWQRLRQCMDDDVSVGGAVVATNRGGIIVEVGAGVLSGRLGGTEG